MSKISDYKLDNIVLDLKSEGKSNRKIADALNKIIPQGDEPISEMAVSRWLRANAKKGENLPLLPDDKPTSINANGVEDSEDVDPYQETLNLINDCDLQIELLKKRIESTKSTAIPTKVETDNISMLSNYIARKQSLLSDIAKYQKEMASFASVKEMMGMVVNIMKSVSPEAYNRFKEEIVTKQHIKNMLK